MKTTRWSVSEGKRFTYPFFSRRLSIIVRVDLPSCVSLAKIPIEIGGTRVTLTLHKILRILACSGLISRIPDSLRSLPIVRTLRRWTRASVTPESFFNCFLNSFPKPSNNPSTVFSIFVFLAERCVFFYLFAFCLREAERAGTYKTRREQRS